MDIFLVFIRYIAATGILWGAGYALTVFAERLFSRGRGAFLTIGQRASLGLLVGSGFLSLYMFGIGVFGARYSLAWFIPFFAVAALLFILAKPAFPNLAFVTIVTKARLGWRVFARRPRTQKGALFALGLLLAAHIGFQSFQTVFTPTYFDDAVHTWNLRPKLLFYHGGLFLDKSDPLSGWSSEAGYGFQMRSYPLFSTLLKLYLAEFTGGFFDPVINSIGLLILLSALGFLFSTLLAHTKSVFLSAAMTYIAGSIPLADIHTSSGYVDFLFGLLALVSTTFLFLWLDKKEIFSLVGAVLFLGLAAFMKMNPFALFLIPFIVTLLASSVGKKREFLIVLGVLAAGLALLVGPWLAFKGLLPWQIFSSARFELHLDALGVLMQVLFAQGSYNIFFFGFVLFLIVFAAKKFQTRYAPLVLYGLLLFLFLIGVFLASQYGQYLKDQTTFNRAMLTVLPTLIFIVGITTWEWARGGYHRRQVTSKQ